MSRVVWITARPRVPATGAEVIVRLAGGGRDKPYLHPVTGEQHRAGVAKLPRFAATLDFDENGWTGGTVPTTGKLRFAPAQHSLLSELANHYWPEAPITIEVGPEGVAPTLILTGTADSIATDEVGLVIDVADLSNAINKPLIAARFAGTGGIEGGVEATGRVKRRSWGRVFNVEGLVLDKTTNVYEFGDLAFPLNGFAALRDMGRAGTFTTLPWQGSVAATLTALKAATPVAGGGVVAPSIACVKWWTQPVGPLTADLTGEVGTGYVETVPEIAARISAAAGGPAISNTAAMAAARPEPAGLHVGDGLETAAGALDRLLLGASLLWVLQPAGTIVLRAWTFSAPVASLTSISVKRTEIFKPMKTRRVGYQRSHRRHSDGEIAAVLQVADVEGLPDVVDRVIAGLDEDGNVDRPLPEQIRVDSDLVTRPGGGGEFTGELAADVTGTHTAAAIAGQGALATASSAAYATQISGLPVAILPANLDSGRPLASNLVFTGGPGTATIQSLRPDEAGANVTLTHQAASITGQGALATSNTAAWGSQITSRPAELTDGRIAAGIDASGDLNRNITTGRRDASNLLGRTGGGLFGGELLADVTLTHTAAAITSQGALATANSANWDTQITSRPVARLFADNLLDLTDWRIGGSVSAGQFIGEYGGADDSYVIINGPDGNPEVVRKLTGSAATTVDGGWQAAPVDAADGYDPTQPYLVAIWVMRPAFRTDGVTATTGFNYFGPHGAVTQRWTGSGWADDGNPYWMPGLTPDGVGTSDRGKWYLWIGMLYGSDFTGTTDPISGIYNPVTGQRIYTPANIYRSKPASTTNGHRIFQYIATTGNIMYYARPLFARAPDAGGLVRQLLATVGGQFGLNILRETGVAVTDLAAITALGQAATIASQGALATLSAADFATQVSGAAKPEALADVTKSIGSFPSAIWVEYTYAGAVKGGQLGRTFTAKLITAAGTELGTGLAWHYRVVIGGVNGKTSADGWVAITGAGTGQFPLTTYGGTETVVQLRATYGGNYYYSLGTMISMVQDAPPLGGGGGGGSGVIASNNPSTSINSTTYATITGALTATVPTGKTSVTVAAQLNLLAEEATPAGTWNVDVKVQRDVAGVWTDVGAAAASDPDTSVTNEGGGLFVRYVDGYAIISVNDTGLTAGNTYAWRVQAKLSSGTKTTFVTGTVTVTA